MASSNTLPLRPSVQVDADTPWKNLKLLILAGGKSTRMGSPKHLLVMPDGRPLYQHQIDILREACPEAKTIYISLAQDSDMDDFLRRASKSQLNCTGQEKRSTVSNNDKRVEIILDSESSEAEESKGPAAGLLAAFESDSEATWLVVACDYPCITSAALQQLQSLYKPPVTCFRNKQGFCEPLLGIWSPAAISHLKNNCERGKLSPSKAVYELDGYMHIPELNSEVLLRNVNTKSEWESALRRLADIPSDHFEAQMLYTLSNSPAQDTKTSFIG
ncbi:hypothetical protein FSARC_9539 [Fusarium sarcochroum]|uniref:MobA-like NTP transferase domain-containing protein n=1 Tax=Fusarium sarcochroum TaxID=1208366 RepID=A0A8H4X584_9HYPO|nr:hypothetical protein FSARC_9539 [Fusarium sarcochroum]